MFIQWKGTDLCMDFYCACGAHCHFDGYFSHFVGCPHCGAAYELGTQVRARKLADEETEGRDRIQVMEPDEDLDSEILNP